MSDCGGLEGRAVKRNIFGKIDGVMGFLLADADGNDLAVPFDALVLALIDGRLLELNVASYSLVEPTFSGIDAGGIQRKDVATDCVQAVLVKNGELSRWRLMGDAGPRMVSLVAA